MTPSHSGPPSPNLQEGGYFTITGRSPSMLRKKSTSLSFRIGPSIIWVISRTTHHHPDLWVQVCRWGLRRPFIRARVPESPKWRRAQLSCWWHLGRWPHPGGNDCVEEGFPAPRGGVCAAERTWSCRSGGRASQQEPSTEPPPTQDPRPQQRTGRAETLEVSGTGVPLRPS